MSKSKDNLKTLPPLLPALAEWKEKLENDRRRRRDELIEALRLEHGYVARAARRLGLSRQRVIVLIEEMELQEFVTEQRAKRRG